MPHIHRVARQNKLEVPRDKDVSIVVYYESRNEESRKGEKGPTTFSEQDVQPKSGLHCIC
jgi:hypothetical protein